MATVLCIHFACTWMLAGVIWMIQIVAYPQFLRVGRAEFSDYHLAHCWRIGLLITPLLAVEALTAAGLFYQGHRESAFLMSVALIPVSWLSTALFQAPMHVSLMKGFDEKTIRRLILSNWLRTLAWTARGAFIGYLVLT